MSKMFRDKKEYYSLRKFKGVGLASALVGLAFLSPSVMAEEVATPNTAIGDVSVVSSTPESDKVGETSENTVIATTNTTPEVVKEDSVANETVVSEESSKPVETDKPAEATIPVVEDLPKVVSPKLEENSDKQPTEGNLNTRSSEPVVTESSQPTRSRRGKRDVSGSDESSTGVIKVVDLNGKDSENIPAIGRKSVTSIDYTSEANPQSAPIGDNYNNQISKIEIVNSDDYKVRIRVSLKDGETIPDGGTLQLVSLGLGDSVSTKLYINGSNVGSISTKTSSRSVDLVKNFKDRFASLTSVDNFIETFKGTKRFDYPAQTVTLNLNSRFSSFNRNRFLEFELVKKLAIL